VSFATITLCVASQQVFSVLFCYQLRMETPGYTIVVSHSEMCNSVICVQETEGSCFGEFQTKIVHSRINDVKAKLAIQEVQMKYKNEAEDSLIELYKLKWRKCL
jgi:hypothetical protein